MGLCNIPQVHLGKYEGCELLQASSGVRCSVQGNLPESRYDFARLAAMSAQFPTVGCVSFCAKDVVTYSML